MVSLPHGIAVIHQSFDIEVIESATDNIRAWHNPIDLLQLRETCRAVKVPHCYGAEWCEPLVFLVDCLA